MRIVSIEETRLQISQEGKDWDIFPMDSVFGEVLAAEEVLVKIPVGPFGVLVEVDRDITSVSQDYPFSSLLGNRFSKDRREDATRQEVAVETKKRNKRRPYEDAMAEFLKEYRHGIVRGRVTVGGPRGQNASTGTRYGRRSS